MNALSCACIRVRAYKLLPSDHRETTAPATGKARAVKGITGNFSGEPFS